MVQVGLMALAAVPCGMLGGVIAWLCLDGYVTGRRFERWLNTIARPIGYVPLTQFEAEMLSALRAAVMLHGNKKPAPDDGVHNDEP